MVDLRVVVVVLFDDVQVVDDAAEDLAADVLEDLLGAGRHGLRVLAVLDHEHDPVHEPGEHRGVAHADHGRRIEQDDVVLVVQVLDALAHVARIEQAHRVGRQLAARQHEQARHLGGHGEPIGIDVAQQHVGEPLVVGDPEQLVHARAPEVAVDDQDPVALACGDDAQVDQTGGLAFADAAARDQHGAQLRVLPGELDVGPEHPVRLVGGRLVRHLGQQLDPLRDHAQDRHAEAALEVVDGLDACVEVLDEVGQPGADREADEHADQHVHEPPRSRRARGRHGQLGDDDARGRDAAPDVLHDLLGPELIDDAALAVDLHLPAFELGLVPLFFEHVLLDLRDLGVELPLLADEHLELDAQRVQHALDLVVDARLESVDRHLEPLEVFVLLAVLAAHLAELDLLLSLELAQVVERLAALEHGGHQVAPFLIERVKLLA